MPYTFYKLFVKKDKTDSRVTTFEYNTNDYYSFVKKYVNNGYRQVVISSSTMLSAIKELVFRKKYDVSKIEFLEDDDTYRTVIDSLIVDIQTDRVFYSKLFDQLQYLSEKSSIDLKKVYLRSAFGSVLIQVNGIIGIYSEASEDELVSFRNQMEQLVESSIQ